MSARESSWQMARAAMVVLFCVWMNPAPAVTIDMVTVGNPENANDTTGYGAVATAFQIMRHEFTNQQYTDFLNAIDPQGANPNSVWNSLMGNDGRGGISFNSGASPGSKYSVKTNMGNKPVNFVSFFSAARVANWLHNGQGNGSTESGAYTLNNQVTGTPPAKNGDARFYIPTENEWYKAAYFDPYRGGSGGYWKYATQSDERPVEVTADETGEGSGSSIGNHANFNVVAVWNGVNGNVTTVGTNGGVSAYGTFDQSGNLNEWNDLTGTDTTIYRGNRGGGFASVDIRLTGIMRDRYTASDVQIEIGFRLASPAVAVPEPSAWVMGLAGLACGGWHVLRKRSRHSGGAVRGAATAFAVSVLVIGGASSAHAVTIDMVPVGDSGNANDTKTGNLYGGVGYAFQMGKHEVTIDQYTEFLNAVAKTDTYSLYNPNMGNILNIAGITRSGSSGSYTYAVTGPNGSSPAGADSPGNRPITYVSWFDAARFSNWMHNGQGSSSTETGAYDLAVPGTARSPTAQFYIPTESEWYKAAYFSPHYDGLGMPGYFDYATQSNLSPGNVLGFTENQANYRAISFKAPEVIYSYSVTQAQIFDGSQNYLTNVGAFTNSESFYGTFDQSGNVYEWNDLGGTAGMDRGVRGGSWQDTLDKLASSYRPDASLPSDEYNNVGFRLASPAVAVPEPSAWVMGLAGLACGGWHVFRRRKPASPVV